MIFVKLDNQGNVEKYPYTLDMFREENKNVSLPKNLSLNFLEKRNIFRVYSPVEKPEGFDEINQRLQNDMTPIFHEARGRWEHGWLVFDKTPDVIEQEFNGKVKEFRKKIDDARDSAIYKTVDAQVSAEKTVPVDIRRDKPDIQNISGLVQGATIRLLNNDNSTVPFMAADNLVYDLTPQEIITMGQIVASHYSDKYAQSWSYKSQLDQCTTIEEINAIGEINIV